MYISINMYIYTHVCIFHYITVQCMLSWNTQNLCQKYCYQSVLSFHKLLVKNTCAECAGFDGIKWRQCLGNRKKRLKLPFNILVSHRKNANYPLVFKHSYWKWPIHSGFCNSNGDVPVRYVRLPEGTLHYLSMAEWGKSTFSSTNLWFTPTKLTKHDARWC